MCIYIICSYNKYVSDRETNRMYDGKVPGPVDVSVGAVHLVVFDPLNVRLKVAEDDASERHRIANVHRLVMRRLRYYRRVWKHR